MAGNWVDRTSAILRCRCLALAFQQRIVRGVLNERVPERIFGIGEHSVLLQKVVAQEFIQADREVPSDSRQ